MKMLVKAVVLLSVLSVCSGCSTSILNQIFAMISNPPNPAPVTMAPVTVAPVTVAPVTVAPVTVAPVTVAPVTVAPVTVAPVTVAPPPPGPNCECGKPNRVTRIVGGTITEENEYPWQVGLVEPGYTPSCGGSIIGQKEILTAAHCTAGKTAADIEVLVGGHNTLDGSSGTRVTVCAINDHPSYDGDTLENDYSVLTLCNSLTFTKNVSPVCLPNAGDGAMFEGKDSVVTGWGTTSSGGSVSFLLKETTVRTMTNNECCTGNYQYGCGQITDVMMCAANPGTDSCQGDSGGPLVYYQGSANYVQTGVVSFGTGCADPQYPGVYARVSKVMPWIQSVSSTSNFICAP